MHFPPFFYQPSPFGRDLKTVQRWKWCWRRKPPTTLPPPTDPPPPCWPTPGGPEGTYSPHLSLETPSCPLCQAGRTEHVMELRIMGQGGGVRSWISYLITITIFMKQTPRWSGLRFPDDFKIGLATKGIQPKSGGCLSPDSVREVVGRVFADVDRFIAGNLFGRWVTNKKIGKCKYKFYVSSFQRFEYLLEDIWFQFFIELSRHNFYWHCQWCARESLLVGSKL